MTKINASSMHTTKNTDYIRIGEQIIKVDEQIIRIYEQIIRIDREVIGKRERNRRRNLYT